MRREWIPAALALVAFAIGTQMSPYFLDFRYLLDSSTLYVEIGLLALGMTLVIVSGNIDLSVGSTMALVAVLATKMLEAGWSPALVFPLALLLGGMFGAFNGALVAYAALPSFMVTIGTMAFYRGIAHTIVGAKSAEVPPALVGIDFVTIPGTPIPLSLPILLILAAASAFLLNRTVWGRWISALGTNEKATIYSGVPTNRVKVIVFALSGLMAALAAMHLASRLGVARYDHGRGIEVDVITAVVLGGTAIAGGKGTVWGTMIALLLLALIRTGMGVANVKAEYQLAIIGALLIVTVLVGNLHERYAVRRSNHAVP